MKRILVIDDEVSILRVLEIILSSNNYVVEAISKWQYLPYSIQYFKPDLILLDVFLGGADGREICKQLKNYKKMKNLVKISIFALALGFFASCSDDAKTEETTTNSDTTTVVTPVAADTAVVVTDSTIKVTTDTIKK